MNKDEIVEALRVESLVHRWTGILTGVIAGSIFMYAAGRLCHRVYKVKISTLIRSVFLALCFEAGLHMCGC
jgi:hypothetical protein